MDNVIEWLNKDIVLSEKIDSIPDQFANGYLFGELLYRYNQILEFPGNFKNKNYKNAMVDNFTNIEACIRNLNIKFTVSMAQEIICKNLDTTFLLLRSLKNALEKTHGVVDVNVLKKTGAKNITFPVNKFNFSKDRFAIIQNQIFHKRLSNILKPQDQVILDKKVEKFVEFQSNEEEKVNDLKYREKEEREEEIAYNREQLINQLKRTMNFGKQWESECRAQWETNIAIGKERVKEKEFFLQQLKSKQKLNQLKAKKNNEETVKNELDEFEEIHLKKKTKPTLREPMNTFEEKLGNREKNINALTSFLYYLTAHTPAIKIKERMKGRENILNSELSKKERDRRLRKMLVDVRKYQSFKDLNTKKKSLLSKIMINSVQENKLYTEFEKIVNYRDVFVENKKLRETYYNEKKKEIIQRNIDMKNYEAEEKTIENRNLLKAFSKQIDHLEKKNDLMKYRTKYDMCKKDLLMLLDSSFNMDTLFSLFNTYEMPEIIKPVFIHNFKTLKPFILDDNKEKNVEMGYGYSFIQMYFGKDYFIRDIKSNENEHNFMHFFMNSFATDFNVQNFNDNTPNFMHLPLKIAILGLPYSNHFHISNYIKEAFNLVLMDTKSLIQIIMDKATEGSLTSDYKEEIISALRQGKSFNNFSQLFIKGLSENFAAFENETEYLKELYNVAKENNRLAIKVADEIPGPNTINTNLINLKEMNNQNLEDKENRIDNEQNENNDLKITVKPNKKHLGLSKEFKSKSLKHDQLSKINLDEENLNSKSQIVQQKSRLTASDLEKSITDNKGLDNFMDEENSQPVHDFIDDIKPRGVLFVDYPYNVEECLKLEKELSRYIPLDQRESSSNDELNKLIMNFYGDILNNQKSIEKTQVFFDLIINVTCNKDEIFERAISDKKTEYPEDLIQKLSIQIMKKHQNMKNTEEFYKVFNEPSLQNISDDQYTGTFIPSSGKETAYNSRSNCRKVFTIDSSKPEYETIPKIESLIKEIFQNKLKHYREVWSEHEALNSKIEEEKQIMANMIEEANICSLVSDEEIKSHLEDIKESYSIKELMKSLNPQPKTVLASSIKHYNDSLNRFYSNLKTHFSIYFLNQFKLVSGCLSLFTLEDQFNLYIQNYIQEYNNFVYTYKRLLNTEDVKNELHLRVHDVTKLIEKEITNAVNYSDKCIKGFYESPKHYKYIENLISPFLGLLITELQKLIIEHYLISYYEYVEINYDTKETENYDKKAKKPVQEYKTLPPIEIPVVCKSDLIIEQLTTRTEGKKKDDNKSKQKRDTTTKINDNMDDFDLLMGKIEIIFSNLIKSVEDNRLEEFTENSASTEQPKGNLKDKSKVVKTNLPEDKNSSKYTSLRETLNSQFISKTHSIKYRLNDTLLFLKDNKQKVIDYLHEVKGDIQSRYNNLSDELAMYLVSAIEQNECIKRYIEVKDGQLVEDAKRRYNIDRTIEIPQIIEKEEKDRFSCNNLFEIYKFAVSIRNAFGLCDKTKILNFLKLNCLSDYNCTFIFPQKWRSLDLSNIESICNSLESETYVNHINCSYFTIAMILEEFTAPTEQLLDFYDQFSDVNPYMSREEFIDVSLIDKTFF